VVGDALGVVVEVEEDGVVVQGDLEGHLEAHRQSDVVLRVIGVKTLPVIRLANLAHLARLEGTPTPDWVVAGVTETLDPVGHSRGDNLLHFR